MFLVHGTFGHRGSLRQMVRARPVQRQKSGVVSRHMRQDVYFLKEKWQQRIF